MKRSRKPAGLVVGLIMMFVLATGTMAHAVSFEDMIDTWGVFGDARPIVQGHPFSYTHDINDDVDFAAGYRVTAAWLELDFTNDLTDSNFWILWDYREYVNIGFDGASWVDIGEVDSGQYEIVLNIDWLNDNGLLDVTINVSNPLGTASAWLDHSRLYGEAELASVPEPGTLLLLGLGLFGVVALGRKKLSK